MALSVYLVQFGLAVKMTDFIRQIHLDHNIGLVHQIGREFFSSALGFAGSCVQIKLSCVVCLCPLHLENFRSQFYLSAVGPQEVSKRELGKSRREGVLRVICYVLVAVVHLDLQEFGGQHLLESHWISAAH